MTSESTTAKPLEESKEEPADQVIEELKNNNKTTKKQPSINLDPTTDKKIIKKKSTKITEETIELTDPKAVAEALGLNEKKKKEAEPTEIEEEVDLESLEMGKVKK